MATVDIKSVGKAPIRTLAGRARSFVMWPEAGTSWAGATITFSIRRNLTGPDLYTLTWNQGIKMLPQSRISITIPPLPKGDYYYDFVITPVSGEEVHLIDRLIVQNG